MRSRCQNVKESKVHNTDYPKLLEIEKEIVREVALGDKHHLRKSTDRKAQISPVSGTNAFSDLCFSICRFSQVMKGVLCTANFFLAVHNTPLVMFIW